jgi:hypothetical protein
MNDAMEKLATADESLLTDQGFWNPKLPWLPTGNLGLTPDLPRKN